MRVSLSDACDIFHRARSPEYIGFAELSFVLDACRGSVYRTRLAERLSVSTEVLMEEMRSAMRRIEARRRILGSGLASQPANHAA